MTTTPRQLPGLIRDALDHGWNVHIDQDEAYLRARFHRWNRALTDHPRDRTVVTVIWDESGHLTDSTINASRTPLAQCRALIREGATP